jgi:Ras-related protein Rab-1A
VGKSSLILRFVSDVFSEDQVVSIGEDFREKKVTVDGKTVTLQLWDTAGQERYRIITSSFYHNAHGVMIVYDTSNRESFENVGRWSQEVDRYLDVGVKVVVGNKCDLDAGVARADEAEEMCDNIGAEHYLASAKTGKGIAEAFEGLARGLIAEAEKAAAHEAPPPSHVTQVQAERSQKGCCHIL